MSMLSYVARRFVAGEEMNAALEAVRLLNAEGLLVSLDFLGENVSNDSEAEMAAEEYLRLLTRIDQMGIRGNVSLKLTQMGLDLGEKICQKRVSRILEKAASLRNFVRIDMEGTTYTERTLNVFHRLYADHKNVGIVLQAYLHRSDADAAKLATIQAPVRVCKGAYKEPDSLAFQNMEDIRRSFQGLVEVLLKGGSRVGIATHDERLIRWALEWTGRERIPREQFEFQMLYGLRRARGRKLQAEGYTVRYYVPYGTHWFPYFVRRLRERKENIFFVLRSLVSDA